MFRHAMIDLETFGLRRGNAIRSISVVPFDPFAGLIADRDWWFHQNVDFASQEAVGLTKDPGTVEWWNKPEHAAAQRLLEPNQETLGASLMYLDRYLRGRFEEGFRVWSRGMMDQEVLEGVYDALGRELPYHYRAPRDTRGFLDLVEFDPGFDGPNFEGIPHFGPDDAYHECKGINLVFEHCGLQRFGVIEAEYSGYAEIVDADAQSILDGHPDNQAQKFQGLADVIAETGMTGAGDQP